MLIERRPLTDLQPAPYNPRVALRPGDPGFERLKRSLAEFQLVQPIVWNRRTGHVVGGHQRVEVLRHLGHADVDCAVVDLSLEREKALNVALNNAHVGGRWEPARLVELIEDLVATPDFDATLTGFDDRQLRDLVLAPDPAAEAEDDPPATDHVTVTLDVPKVRWDAVEAQLNALLATEPDLRLHWR